MTVPSRDLAAIRDYCAAQVPAHVQDRVRIESRVRGKTVTIWESQPVEPGDLSGDWFDVGVARMKYDEAAGGWTLYWFDRNTKAHRYEFLPEHQPIQRVLREIADDPTAIFWG